MDFLLSASDFTVSDDAGIEPRIDPSIGIDGQTL
jgi:hypothetical protein